jgi:hypothetical protein
MDQPGPQRTERVMTAMGGPARRLLVTLAPGQTLQKALLLAFARGGVSHGSLELLGGDLSAAYHTGRAAPAGGPAAEYGPPIRPLGILAVLRGNGSFGPAMDGSPMLHIHAALADADGRCHAGHLATNLCLIAGAGLRVLMTAGAGFTQQADPETAFTLFVPVAG